MYAASEAAPFVPAQSDISALIAIQYFAVAALTFCLWDIIICIKEEVTFIWSKSTTSYLTKIAYVFMRYGIAGGIAYALHVIVDLTPGKNHELTCKIFLQLTLLLVMVSSITMNTYITYHHYLLWERRRVILLVLSVAYVVCYVPAVVLAFLAAFEYREIATYIPFFNACLYTRRPKTIQAYFAVSLAFDVVAIAVAILNSFDRPYKRYGEVVASFLRDGAIWFLALFVLRFINLVLFIVMPPAESFIMSFNVWAMVSITQSRFMLRVEELRRPRASLRVWDVTHEAFELGRWSGYAG